MPVIETTPVPEGFLEKQVELLRAGDAEGLAQRYHEDAIILRLDRVAKGREEIKKFFEDYIAQRPEIVLLDGAQITENLILYQAAERLDGKIITAVGTLVLVNGLIWRQTADFQVGRPTPVE